MYSDSHVSSVETNLNSFCHVPVAALCRCGCTPWSLMYKWNNRNAEQKGCVFVYIRTQWTEGTMRQGGQRAIPPVLDLRSALARVRVCVWLVGGRGGCSCQSDTCAYYSGHAVPQPRSLTFSPPLGLPVVAFNQNLNGGQGRKFKIFNLGVILASLKDFDPLFSL